MCVPVGFLVAAFLAGEGGERTPPWVRCTPHTIEVEGRGVQPASNPIARALEAAEPGSVVYLDPGDYPPFSIGLGSSSQDEAKTSGGEPGWPIVIDGVGRARIVGTGDTIAIDQRTPNGWITFRDLTIVPGQRAGVMFYRQGDRVHRGYSFEDCHILGGFDHASGTGRNTKWGVSAHSVADFRFVGVRAPARIEGLRTEHAFYMQNPQGDVLIQNVSASGLGRTFCQFTARASEGPPGRGDITIKDCDVHDVALAAGDGFKGGSAFTFAGRLESTILLEGNTYRAGYDERFTHLTRPGQPYGSGAVAAWQGGESVPNGTLVLRDNTFEFADGCGDRPVVSIGGCRKVLIVGRNRLRAGGDWPALALDPVEEGVLVSAPNGLSYIAPMTSIEGRVTLAGAEATEEELVGLRRGR